MLWRRHIGQYSPLPWGVRLLCSVTVSRTWGSCGGRPGLRGNPVVVPIAAGVDGAQLENGFGAASPQRAPVMPSRSCTRCRHAPSMTPVAMGRPWTGIRVLHHASVAAEVA